MNENDQLDEVEKLPEGNDVLLTDAPITPEQHAPEDVAAQFFMMQKSRLFIMLDKLSAKQLRRLLFNVCSYPFVDKQYMPRTEEEKSTAFLVHELMLNKTIMQLSFEMQKAEEGLKKQEEDVKLNSEVKDEEVNKE